MYDKLINRLSVVTFNDSDSLHIAHERNSSVTHEMHLSLPEVIDLHYMLGQVINAAKDKA